MTRFVTSVLARSLAAVRASVLACSAAALLPLAAQAAPEEVTYLLPAPPNSPAFAPWMLAQQNGYYADENIKVTFVTARGGVDVAKQIGAGNAVIGGAIGDTPIIVRANGVPVKAVAVLGAGSLTMISTYEGSGINSVADLKGKTMTVMAYTDTTYYALLGSLRKAGLTKTDVQAQAAGPTGVWQLFAGKKSEAMAGVPDWVVNAEDAGVKVKLLPREQHFQSMAQAILASDDVIKKNPELIKRLVRATLRGMQDIMKDPKAAAATYVKAVPAYAGKEAQIERVFALYNQYVYANQKVLGQMDEKRLDAVQKFYVDEGIVAKAQPLADLYTNQFTGVAR
ncbi:MAG: ABC transporter substrate-binding protein [Aquincola tertiaricarbonis]|uniref:ABC transporter substrate-binding protein n=1 Tax=Aquincola TaxID=391952 RepID=UPI0006153186|nr:MULTISPECIES: ABC transporter substrate-binding protein [Aquincola]MCR5866695.1 ABC transporter substrate-binding protein [Aquincola sp. J276]